MVVFNVEKFDAKGNYFSYRENEIAKAFQSYDNANKKIFFDAVSQEVNFSIQQSALADFYTKISFQVIKTSYHTQISEKFTTLLSAISDIFKGATNFLQSLAYLPVSRAYAKVYLYTAVRDLQELIGNITMIFHHARGRYWVDQANFHKAVYALYGTKIEIAEEVALPAPSSAPAEEAPSPNSIVEESSLSSEVADLSSDGRDVEIVEEPSESSRSATPPPRDDAIFDESAKPTGGAAAPSSPYKKSPFKLASFLGIPLNNAPTEDSSINSEEVD